jgi:hypothetical protein
VKGPTDLLETVPDSSKLPNYVECDRNPVFEIGEFGIGVAFADRDADMLRVAHDERCPVYGSYAVGRNVLRKLGKDLLGRLTITITNQKTGQIQAWPLVSGARVSKPDRYDEDELEQIACVGGYFNIDLKDHCVEPGGHGRFWVVFQLGQYLSPALEVDILPPHAAELARTPMDLFASGEDAFGGGEEAAHESYGADDGYGDDDDFTRADYGADSSTLVAPAEEAFGEGDDATRIEEGGLGDDDLG